MRFPGAFRENTPRRGNTQCRIARSSPTTSAATQSPTAGQAASPSKSATPRNFPDGSAQHSPRSPAILQSPRCCETTRAGFTLSSRSPNLSVQNASKYPFQPNSSKSTRAPSCRKAASTPRPRERSAVTRFRRSGAQSIARRRKSQAQQLNSMDKRKGRCYLPEESEEKSPEAHPPAGTSTRIVTGASKAELRLNQSAGAQYSRPVALCPRNSLPRSHSPNEARILNCLLPSQVDPLSEDRQ
jgi:hypothetical protein